MGLFRYILQLFAITTLRCNLQPNQQYITENTGLVPFYDDFDEESLTDVVRHHKNCSTTEEV